MPLWQCHDARAGETPEPDSALAAMTASLSPRSPVVVVHQSLNAGAETAS